MSEGMVTTTAVIHAAADEANIQALVTMVVYANECFMAKYLSTVIKTRLKTEAAHNSLLTFLVRWSDRKQYSFEVSPCRVNILVAAFANIGWATTPIKPSVTAKQPSTMLELVFSRCLVFTATITNTLSKMVKGQLAMLATVIKTSTAYASVVVSSSFPPRKLYITHSLGIVPLSGVSVEFMASPLRLNLFLLFSPR